MEGVVGAEHAHPQERHAADRHVLDRVQGLLVGIAAGCHVFGQDVRVDPRSHRPAFQCVIELVRLDRVFVLVGEADQRGIRGQRGPVNSEGGRHQLTVVSSPAPARPLPGEGRTGGGRWQVVLVPGLLRFRLHGPVGMSEASPRILAMGPDRGHQHRRAAASLVCAGVVTAQPGVQATLRAKSAARQPAPSPVPARPQGAGDAGLGRGAHQHGQGEGLAGQDVLPARDEPVVVQRQVPALASRRVLPHPYLSVKRVDASSVRTENRASGSLAADPGPVVGGDVQVLAQAPA